MQKMIYIVPAITDIAGQCRIVAKDFVEGPFDARKDYISSPASWREAGIMNSRGKVVCFNGTLDELKEMKSCEPLMAGTQFRFEAPKAIEEMLSRKAAENAIRGHLVELGWTSGTSTAIAARIYQTAAGLRKAVARLADYGKDGGGFVLHGEYWSTGQNILSAHSVLIPKTSDPATIKQLTVQFASNANVAIDESYARGLYLRHGIIE